MIQTYTCLSILKLKLNFASVVQTKVYSKMSPVNLSLYIIQ